MDVLLGPSVRTGAEGPFCVLRGAGDDVVLHALFGAHDMCGSRFSRRNHIGGSVLEAG